jgi:hypothetical protein
MSTLNLTLSLERLIIDIVDRVPEFGHIDPERVLVCVSSTRDGGVHGMYAKIHPLRFTGGARSIEVRRGRRRCLCAMPLVTHRGKEMLYVVYFLVPRFLNLPQRDKLITVFHELYHISPYFDGDIRRFPGRNYAHGPSRKQYNARMSTLVDAYIRTMESSELIDFLQGNLETLRSRYRTIVARKRRAPRMEIEYPAP